MNKLSLLLGFLSLLWVVISGVRWMIVYNDTSQAILGIGLGLGGLFCAYIYNWMRNKDEEARELLSSVGVTRDWMRHIIKLNKLREE